MLARRFVPAALTRLPEGRLTVLEGGTTVAFGTGRRAVGRRHGARRAVLDDRRSGAAPSASARRTPTAGSTPTTSPTSAGSWSAASNPSGAGSTDLPTRSRRLRDLVPSRSRGREADRGHVAAHYDLSNDFFDADARPDDVVLVARCSTAPRPARGRAARPSSTGSATCSTSTDDDHLLEIGTGWGGFAVHAASTLRLPGHHDDDLGRAVRARPKRVAEAGSRRPRRRRSTPTTATSTGTLRQGRVRSR